MAAEHTPDKGTWHLGAAPNVVKIGTAYARTSLGASGVIITTEDHDLWQLLQMAGQGRFPEARLKVLTSGRRVGRAPMRLAAALAAHNETER